jgi:ABC-type transport system involved in cytochrome c biogenesis ATPase subunit
VPVLLEARALTVARGRAVLVENLSLSVSPGELLHVAGPNGCGKSSLLRVLGGVVEPRRGRIVCPVPRAYVPERVALPAGMGAERWLALTGAAGVPLADELRRACGRLSKGQLQRVALAGPLHGAAQRAAVLVLDEPWAGLDPQARSRLGDDLVAAAQRGSAIVFTDHTGAAPVRASRTLRLAGDDTEPAAGPQVRIELARDGARATVTVDEPELAALLRDGWEISRGEVSP